MSIGIYKITSPSGRVYIGQSVNIENRLSSYRHLKCLTQTRLLRSLKKYGFENHSFEIIMECEQKDLNFWEEYFIWDLDTFGTKNGLNLRSGGGSSLNSDETKKRMSEAQKGRVVSAYTRELIRNVNQGRIRPDQDKIKISHSMKGMIKTPEHLLNISISLKSSKKFKDAQKKVSEGNMKQVINMETGVVYESAKEAAFCHGFLKSTLVNSLNGFRKNRTSLMYI